MCDAEGELDVALLSLPYFAFWAVLLGVIELSAGVGKGDRNARSEYANPVYKQRLLL